MASANITLAGIECTIEVDTTQRTATKLNTNAKGWLVNAGTGTVYINFSSGTVATNDAQNTTGIIGLLTLGTISVRRSCPGFTYKMAAGTSVLYWFPEE